jgi:hypothetical protein
MSHFQYKVGLHNVGSFQTSGKPWVTGAVDCYNGGDSTTNIDFPFVTNWVQIINVDGNLPVKVGFSKLGVNGANGDNFYFTVGTEEFSNVLDLKVTQLWISGSDNVEVLAGLTGILTDTIDCDANSPDGSNWSGSANI